MAERTRPRPVYVGLRHGKGVKFWGWGYWQFNRRPQCQPGDVLHVRQGKHLIATAVIARLEEAELPARPEWGLPARVIWKAWWDPETLTDLRPPLHASAP